MALAEGLRVGEAVATNGSATDVAAIGMVPTPPLQQQVFQYQLFFWGLMPQGAWIPEDRIMSGPGRVGVETEAIWKDIIKNLYGFTSVVIANIMPYPIAHYDHL